MPRWRLPQWRWRKYGGVLMSDEPIVAVLFHYKGETRYPRYSYSLLDQLKFVKTDAHNGCISQNGHVALGDSDLLAGFRSRVEIFPNRLSARVKLGARYAVQQCIRGIESHDCLDIIRRDGASPAINDSACVLGWACKSVQRTK